MVNVWLPLQLYKEEFDSKSLFTDTDSLTYETKSKDIYEESFKH